MNHLRHLVPSIVNISFVVAISKTKTGAAPCSHSHILPEPTDSHLQSLQSYTAPELTVLQSNNSASPHPCSLQSYSPIAWQLIAIHPNRPRAQNRQTTQHIKTFGCYSPTYLNIQPDRTTAIGCTFPQNNSFGVHNLAAQQI
jgi:hypothetical protein